jgi:predicted O-methyltransferase YrrM
VHRYEGELAPLLEGVDGWLHPAEGSVLHGAALEAYQAGPAVVVEIGSWQGRSTIALASAAREAHQGPVVAIDPHVSTVAFDGDHNLAMLRRNLADRDLLDLVDIVRSPSAEASSRFGDGTISVLFVDGDHSDEGAATDVRAFTPKLRCGAVVGFNDPHLPGVAKALAELVVTGRSGYSQPSWTVNSMFFRYGEGPMSRTDIRRARAFLNLGGRYHRFLTRLGERVADHERMRRIVTSLNGTLMRRVLSAVLPETK